MRDKDTMRCLLMILSVSVSVSAYSQKYLRSGAAGANNGNNWTDAYASSSTFFSNLTRGTTNYVASGSYSGFTFSTAQSGSSSIIVRKATISEHGTSVGWVDIYGGGQAMFGPSSITTGFFTFDGVLRNINNWWDGSSYGFCITNAGYGIQMAIGNTTIACQNVTNRFIYVASPFGVQVTSTVNVGFDTRTYSSGAMQNTNIVISYCYSEGASQPYWLNDVTMPTLEYSCSYATSGNANNHCETVNLFYDNYGGGVIRYNKFRDHCNGANGTDSGGSTGLIAMAYTGQNSGSTDIYGNEFDGFNAYGIEGGSWSGVNNVHIYNNTFVNRSGDTIYGTVHLQDAGSSGCIVSNNLATSTLVSFTGLGNFGLNYSSNSSVYVNFTSRNLMLSSATVAGATLAAPYNFDINGSLRGADGTWDIGAYEYNAGGGGATISVKNLRVGP